MRRLRRWAVPSLVLANVGVLLLLLTLVAWDRLTASTIAGHPPQAGTSASASPDLMQMGLAHIPTNNACVLCHEGGGKGSVREIPVVLHPIDGWRRCLTCHTNPDLGRKAPGHDGVAEEECLNCHTVAQPGAPITQPHAMLHDQHCLDCHGSVAHLPTSMATSEETDCVLCHKPAALPPPSYPHAPNLTVSCRSCHQAQQVGALPIDHALRGDATCLLCHDIRQAGRSLSPGALSSPRSSPVPSLVPD